MGAEALKVGLDRENKRGGLKTNLTKPSDFFFLAVNEITWQNVIVTVYIAFHEFQLAEKGKI